jgi:hypothetical protein
MAKTAADVLIDTIIDWDVDVIFGLPGDIPSKSASSATATLH